MVDWQTPGQSWGGGIVSNITQMCSAALHREKSLLRVFLESGQLFFHLKKAYAKRYNRFSPVSNKYVKERVMVASYSWGFL